jgi:zinc protease
MVEKIWGTWPARKAVRDKTIPFAPPLTANLHCHVEMPLCRQLTLVTGGYGPIRDSPDYLEARVADTVIGKLGIQGRIGRSLRKEGAAYECGSRLGAGAGPIAEPWCIYATISPEHLRMAVDIILNETRRLCEEHIEEEELANAKAHLIGSLQLKLGSCTGMASLLAAVEINQLPEDYAVCFGQHINAIDPEAVRAAAHSYLNRSGRVLATAGTEAEWH